MRIQQAKDLYELADEGQEKIDAKAALKRELQKEVPKHEDMLAKVKADANTNPSARSEGASMLSWAWFPGRGSLGVVPWGENNVLGHGSVMPHSRKCSTHRK